MLNIRKIPIWGIVVFCILLFLIIATSIIIHYKRVSNIANYYNDIYQINFDHNGLDNRKKIDLLQELIKTHSSNYPPYIVFALFELSYLYTAENEFEKAIEVYLQILQNNSIPVYYRCVAHLMYRIYSHNDNDLDPLIQIPDILPNTRLIVEILNMLEAEDYDNALETAQKTLEFIENDQALIHILTRLINTYKENLKYN
ncbi:MAG: hypothetical protein P857_740 [Candidatus Xenolissoclinum pacificiensis L6]|uniref:Tetratricopeptide repeat protein n=1 Tax=Candidatus Xenolissoclinum pacificiensis L6 TaxID=1401685 RepID=W2UYR6_9RICK|nr:MAG: hypothetical protein P857_740 [Candidatus Xenolissoclinum pacificiensis L6]